MRPPRYTSARCCEQSGIQLQARRGSSLTEVMVTVALVGSTFGLLAPTIGKLHNLQGVATDAALRLHHVEIATHALRRDAAEATSCQLSSPRELEFFLARGERVRYRDEGRGLERFVLRVDAAPALPDGTSAPNRPVEHWSQLHLEQVQVIDPERIKLQLVCAPGPDEPGAVRPMTLIVCCPPNPATAPTVVRAAATSIQPAVADATRTAQEETR